MTTLEDQLRSTLRAHARAFSPRGSESEVRRRVQRRRRRRQLVPAVGAAAAMTAAVVVVAQQGDDTARTSTAAEAPDGGVPLGARTDGDPRAQVVLPGWTTTHVFTFGLRSVTPGDLADPAAADTLVGVEYQFARGAQRLQLHVYGGGRGMYEARVGSDPRTDVVAFDRDASLLDYGDGRYRVDVLVGDDTWEFDGEPFASVEDFLAAVESIRLVPHDEWLASIAGAEFVHVATDGGPTVSEAGPEPEGTTVSVPTTAPASSGSTLSGAPSAPADR